MTATHGVAIKVDTKGLDRAQKVLRAIHKMVNDLSPVFDEIGDTLVDRARDRFSKSVGPNGERWRPTKAGNKPLVRTGALMRSIDYTVSRRKMTIGSSLEYAAIHQFGGNAGRGGKSKIPARPYLADAAGNLDRNDVSAIDEIVAKFINRVATGNR